MAVNKLLIDLRDPLSSSKKFLFSSEDVEEKQIHPLRRINWSWRDRQNRAIDENCGQNLKHFLWERIKTSFLFEGVFFLVFLLVGNSSYTIRKKSVLSWSYVSTSFRAEHIKRTHHGQKSFPKSDSGSQDRLWRWWSAAETVSILINRDVFARKIMKFNIWNS